jgi:hypothetical protein
MAKKKTRPIVYGYVLGIHNSRESIRKDWSNVEDTDLYESKIIVNKQQVVRIKNILESRYRKLNKIFC